MRPRLLDLFCGAGGAAMGYHRAGFDVVGVDIVDQPHYPFEFYQADVMEILPEIPSGLWGPFDAIHASPPCQAYSVATNAAKFKKTHPDLVDPTRDLLMASSLPWVMENVEGSPLLRGPALDGRVGVVLCGSGFGLEADDLDGSRLVLKRHRLFESNVRLVQPPCGCEGYRRRSVGVGGVYGGGPENRANADRHCGGGYTPPQDVRRRLMGIDWMNGSELSQAIPPAYTEFIGAQLLAHVQAVNA